MFVLLSYVVIIVAVVVAVVVVVGVVVVVVGAVVVDVVGVVVLCDMFNTSTQLLISKYMLLCIAHCCYSPPQPPQVFI